MKKKNVSRCGCGCCEKMGKVMRPVFVIALAVLAGWGAYRVWRIVKKTTVRNDLDYDFPGTSEYTDADVMVGGTAQPFDEGGSVSSGKKSRVKKMRSEHS